MLSKKMNLSKQNIEHSNPPKKMQRNKNLWPCLLFLAVILLYHLVMREYRGDAINYFNTVLDRYTLQEFLSNRYHSWSSRLLIEAPLVYVARSVPLWKVLNVAIFMLLAFSTMRLFHGRCNTLAASLWLIYPITQMATAGWIATCVNYLWPLALGTFSLIALDKIWHNQHISSQESILYLFCAAFATNQEQFCVFYLCILFFFGIALYISQKRMCGCVYWGQLIIALYNLIFILTCPGNLARRYIEVRHLLDFNTYDLADKIMLGVNATFSSLTGSSVIFFIFTLVLFLCICLETKEAPLFQKHLLRGTAFFPLILMVLRTALKPLITALFPKLGTLLDTSAIPTAITWYNFSAYIPFLIYVLMVIAILVSFLHISGDLLTGIELCVVFTAGMLTRLMMGFSPTLYASSTRTFMFFLAALIFCILRMYQTHAHQIRSHPSIQLIWAYGGMVLVIAAVVNNIISICSY